MPTTRSPALNPVPPGGLDHPAQRLVAYGEAFLAGGRPPVLTVNDLQVGAADADRLGLHQNGPVVWRRLRHVGERDRALLPGDHGDGPHCLTVPNETAARTADILPLPAGLSSGYHCLGAPVVPGNATEGSLCVSVR
jgi:hypothetical protein